MNKTEDQTHLYEQIYAIVRQIPPGKVATYGQVAKIVGRCTPRMVGYALASLRHTGHNVPWQRVINSQGRVSMHGGGIGSAIQEEILREEGVAIDPSGQIDLEAFGWLAKNL